MCEIVEIIKAEEVQTTALISAAAFRFGGLLSLSQPEAVGRGHRSIRPDTVARSDVQSAPRVLSTRRHCALASTWAWSALQVLDAAKSTDWGSCGPSRSHAPLRRRVNASYDSPKAELERGLAIARVALAEHPFQPGHKALGRPGTVLARRACNAKPCRV